MRLKLLEEKGPNSFYNSQRTERMLFHFEKKWHMTKALKGNEILDYTC
jgi:hypothetical protein